LALSRVGKRVQFDEETWQAIDAVMPRNGLTFQELTDEAFKEVQAAGGIHDVIKRERSEAATAQAKQARQVKTHHG
jgi:hypothetical protein